MLHEATASSGFPLSTILMFAAIFLARIAIYGGIAYILYLLVKALRKYLGSGPVNQDTAAVRKTLGETLKEHRIRCKMTQEFVAEHLNVSRQAVSKWENGTSDPSTANLLALAKLFGVSASELLKNVAE